LPSANVAVDQLLFNEVKAYIIKILSPKGFVLVEDKKNANFALVIDYGIDESRTSTNTYSSPTYGITGVTSTIIGTYSKQVKRQKTRPRYILQEI
jgi:hypothetical protein